MSGLVLVWDMDNTLVGNYYDVLDRSLNEVLHFNRNAVALLKEAVAARARGSVDAILMLTNNSDKDFIEHVHNRLKTKLDVPIVFDYIMDRTHEARPQMDDPPKRLEDVEYMMRALDKSTYNLSNRVFFFDDIPDHKILTEIPPSHYIHISPRFGPFSFQAEDETNYKPIRDAISARGGRRSPQKKQKRTRKTRIKRKGGKSKKNLTNILHDM